MHSSAIKSAASSKRLFEIGERVRLRLHPQWCGTVVSRSLNTIISVDWDNHGVGLIDSGLLETANETVS